MSRDGTNQYRKFILESEEAMIKKIILIFGLVALIPLVVFFLNPLARDTEEIRSEILKEIPFGTKLDEVVRIIKTVKPLSELKIYDGGNAIYDQKEDTYSQEIKKTIRVSWGRYGFFVKAYVVVFFGFDENSELIEVIVRKDFDGT